MSLPDTATPRSSRALNALFVSGAFVVVLWASELLDTAMGHSLDANGIRPRSLDGLWGILWAPLLHSGWGHLIANTGPVFVLAFTLLLSGTGAWLRATAIIWVIGGLGTWLIGATGSVHIGASGLVFGWVVYLILRGLFTRRFLQILIGVVVLVAYGGVLWGVFPTDPNVSWQGHLFGAIGGAIAAVITGRLTADERPRAVTPAA